MNETSTARFKRVFEQQKSDILKQHQKVIKDDLSMSVDDRYDEVDQATTDIEQSMQMRLRNRELLYLKKVDEALRRIEDGTFGECDRCGEEIETRRLEARPTATLCVTCKEEEERSENFTLAGRTPKSLGDPFQRNP